MKTISKIKFLSILILGLGFSSCVEDDDFSTPYIQENEPDVEANYSIEQVKNLISNDGTPTLIGNQDSDSLYIEGYVVSSDESGNFYKTLVIQDSPENPEHGISISTEATDTYTMLEPGRKVYIRVDGLYVGEYAGLPTIGTHGEEVGRMSVIDFQERVKRSNTSEDLVPQVITMGQVSDAYLNTLVQFEDVQFPDNLLGESYGNVDNTYTVNRYVENCDGNDIILRNSGFADFKNELLPEGKGSITAVLSVFNSDYQIFIRNTSDVDFDEERCGNEPVGPIEAVELPFNQDFEAEAAGTGQLVSIAGWTNANTNDDEGRTFEVREYDSNKYAQTSAYSSGENPYEAWLVTPGINLEDESSATLSFDTNDGFFNGLALSVHVSTDFNGDPSAATWTELTGANFSTGHTSGYGDGFVSSGDLDLSAYAGQEIYIGFRYLGGDPNVTTTYQIDNISVTGN